MLLTTTSKINAIKEYMKAGDYDSAVQVAEKVNPEKVSSVRDLMTMANAFLKKRRYEDAKEVYVEMHNHASTHKVLVGLIELCLKTNSPEEAETYIREFRKLEPDNPERLIYRYRVDAMLGKGPEYLVKSLSKLKEEDYSDVWGLELAKAYFKMEDYQKCAQECKDVLLWFAGTESAAKAHVLLGACAENGVTVKMPEIKPTEDDYLDDEEAPDVPVIADTTAREEEAEPASAPAVEDDGSFFDLSAAIGETVSEAIAEDREKALSEEDAEDADEAAANAIEETEEEEAVEETAEEVADEAAEEAEAEEAEEEPDLEAVEDIKLPVAEEVPEDAVEELSFAVAAEAEEAAEEETEEAEEAEEAESEEVDDTFFEEEEAEEPEEVEEADDTFFEEEEAEEADEAVEEAAEDEAEEAETEEEPAGDVALGEFDIIALALQKAKSQEDDDDDVVIHDYFPEEEKRKSRSSWDNEDAVPTLVTLPSSYRSEASKPEDTFFEEAEEVEDFAAEEVEDDAEAYEDVESDEEAVEETAETDEAEAEADEEESDEADDEETEEDTFEEKAAFAEVKADSQELVADNEEEDGQISFFSGLNDEDLKIATEDDFSEISGSIADAVKDEMENGRPEADDVSKAPTKVHTDLAAAALDAVLREDDEAIEKALLGLLSDK
ncbi:MAG: hypothetical protein K6F26_08635 [Lachnospiraceae bacterium]|nr:hypothetical protein [Lachnospiraceae bacterium]